MNAGVLALCMAAFMAHELTVYVDLRWAAPRRSISPLEQMVHSVQEILPLSAIALLASLHWEQALSLVGLDGGWDAASFAPVPRRDMFPPAYVGTVIAGGLLLAGCYAEELWRCKRAAAESKDR